MSVSLGARNIAVCLAAIFIAAAASGQSANFALQGGEYQIGGPMPGDQVRSHLALKSSGGYLVWQDNRTDGDGLGISALRLDSTASAVLSPFRVNAIAAGDQENAQVAMLNGGGAVFVWQGGQPGYQHVYARFLSPTNTWLSTNDLLVNTFTNNYQITPTVAVLTNGNVAVVWASYNQASSSSMQDVYAQLLSPTGQKIGGEFLLNQFTTYNQRTPSVAPLANGGFAVAWVSEQQRLAPNVVSNQYDPYALSSQPVSASQVPYPTVDIYARVFTAGGSPLAGEFLVNSNTDVCANPHVAAASDGTFMVVWGQKSMQAHVLGWDIFSRPFSSSGAGGTLRTVNTYLYGDQYAPRIAVLGTDYLVCWTSLGQDGSREGTYAQFLRSDGTPSGAEFRVNTTTIGQQIHPAVSSDGSRQFAVVWSGFTGVANSFDLFAQRYVSTALPLAAPSAPFVNVLSSNTLSITWAAIGGLNLASYQVYADGTPTAAMNTTNNWCDMTGLAPASTHYFQVSYTLTDGRISPLSAATTNTTYGTLTWGGIPYEWMVYYYGTDLSKWPSPNADSDGDGASTLYEYLAGTDPTNQNSTLKTQLQRTQQGPFLTWNTVPGLIYQVQVSSDMANWSNLGPPRLAAGSVDSMNVGGSRANNYRVVRLR